MKAGSVEHRRKSPLHYYDASMTSALPLPLLRLDAGQLAGLGFGGDGGFDNNCCHRFSRIHELHRALTAHTPLHAAILLKRAVRRAVEIRTLAERQMGAFLKEMPKQHGARGIGPIGVVSNDSNQPATLAERQMGAFLKQMPKNDGARGVGKSGVPPENPTLADMGIDKKLSATAQKLANIPEPEFRERVASLPRCGISAAREGQDSGHKKAAPNPRGSCRCCRQRIRPAPLSIPRHRPRSDTRRRQ